MNMSYIMWSVVLFVSEKVCGYRCSGLFSVWRLGAVRALVSGATWVIAIWNANGDALTGCLG